MARGILIESPSDTQIVTGFSFQVVGHVAPPNAAVTVTLMHGLNSNTFAATIDTGDPTRWTLDVTVTDDGDYVLIATQTTAPNIAHSVSFNVTAP